MARYNFDEFIPGYSAMVSTHGHFSVARGAESPGYQSYIWSGGRVVNADGSPAAMPDFVYEGSTREIGVPYDSYMDDLSPEVDDYDIIKEKLIEWSKTRPDLFDSHAQTN